MTQDLRHCTPAWETARFYLKKIISQAGQVQWLTLVIPALCEAQLGTYLRSGVLDQPEQHGETPSLLKIQKLTRLGGEHL